MKQRSKASVVVRALVFALVIASSVSAEITFPEGLVGLWQFDVPEDLTLATVGNALDLVGSHTAVAGPAPDDGAVNIGVGSFYRCFHDIPANGDGANPQWVNTFTILMDVRVPSIGSWYCFYQTNYSNANDGDWFVHPDGSVGVGDTGYSNYELVAGEWYRLAISVNLGEHYDYYLDGQLLHIGGSQDYEGRFSLYPADGANQVLFFADENGEDNALDVAMVALFDRDLSAAELLELDGYGHEIDSPIPPYMVPYLQTPTESSIYVCWHSDAGTESVVEYGATEALGTVVSGDVHDFGSGVIWHWTQLTGLSPETEYFYQCRTDTASSDVYVLRTQPPADATDRVIRFAVYGDNRTEADKHAEVVRALRDKAIEIYGDDLHQQLNLVMNVGDIVTDGNTLSQYTHEFFDPMSSISHLVPTMISIGNHEAEASHFYNYVKYDDLQGYTGQGYYSFRIGPVLFIALNSNVQGSAQFMWLETLLADAAVDTQVDWIFAFLHHPGRSEIWPDGNTSWVQDQVIPLLNQYDKVELLSYGHSHNYERGATSEGNLRLMLAGGGGSALDRWGMYSNQTDYPEINRAHDHYGYTLIEVDCASGSYTAQAYSLGHLDLPLDNVLIDSFIRDRNSPAPETPTALAPAAEAPLPVTLTASPYTAAQPIMSARFELTDTEGDWSSPTVTDLRDWENVYWDTGAPDYAPIDLNALVDLTRLTVDDGTLQLGTTYWWRIRYRDQNLLWSAWSEPATFTVGDLPPTAAFTADVTAGDAPLVVRFSDLSTGTPIGWYWDLDGDGLEDSNARDPIWTYAEVGDYDVTLTVDYDGGTDSVTIPGYISVDDPAGVPQEADTCFTVEQNVPNPFNPTTTVCYIIPDAAAVHVAIFDIRGHLVRHFDLGRQEAGQHTLVWDGRDGAGQVAPSGVYFYRVSAGGFTRTMKAVLMR